MFCALTASSRPATASSRPADRVLVSIVYEHRQGLDPLIAGLWGGHCSGPVHGPAAEGFRAPEIERDERDSDRQERPKLGVHASGAIRGGRYIPTSFWRIAAHAAPLIRACSDHF